MRKLTLIFLFGIFINQVFGQPGTGNNPGSEYGCVVYPTLYPNYKNAYSSTIPRFYNTNPIPIVDYTGSNTYTCGRLNHGFPGYPDDASIDSPDAGTCFVEGVNWGVLRKYKVPVCSVPLDDYISFIVLLTGAISWFSRSRSFLTSV